MIKKNTNVIFNDTISFFKNIIMSAYKSIIIQSKKLQNFTPYFNLFLKE